MANVVSIRVEAMNDTDRAFDKMQESLGKALGNMVKVAAAAGPALVGPIVAGAGAMTAAFVSAGVATAAFGAAVVPQLQNVKKASDEYTKVLAAQDKATRLTAEADALAAKGGKEYTDALAKAKTASAAAKDAQDVYNYSLGEMPKATAETAVAFAKLKDSFQKWSDALAPETMPIFTKGLNAMREALPALTPLVDTAAAAFSNMMDGIDKGIKGGAFKSFMEDMNNAAKQTLPNLLTSLGNIGSGFAGILQAFAPFAGELTDGLEKITAKFKEWGQSLKGSAGFDTWMEGIRDKLPGLLGLFANLGEIAIKLSGAFAPFSEVMLTVVEAFAALVNSIPQAALDLLVPTLAGAAVAMKAFAVATAFASASVSLTPIGAMIIALGTLVGALIATGNANDLLGASFGRMGDGAQSATDKLVSTAEGVAGAALNVIKWVDTLGGLMPSMAGSTDQAANALGDFADTADFASTAVSEFTDTVREAANAAIELSGTQIGLETAIDAAADAVKRNGKSLDISTAAGRENQTALNNIATAALRMGDKMIEAGQDSSSAMAKARASFINAAVNAGYTRAAAGELATQFGLLASAVNKVPNSKKVNVEARTAESIANINKMQALINALHGKSITVTTYYQNLYSGKAPAYEHYAHGGITGAAGGGPRSGMQWVGEQGPELVSLPSGSTVHSAGDSRRMASMSNTGSDVPIIIRLMLDGRQLAEAIYDPLRNQVRSRGGLSSLGT